MRLVLLLVIAGLVLTVVGALFARWLDPQRRLLRFLREALAAEPEGVLMARGAGRALAFNIGAGKIAVLWDRGRKGYVYKLEHLMGAEMMVDNAVLARAYRDEPRLPLDEIPTGAHRSVLRVVFDNPRDPDYEIELWPAYHGKSHEYPTPADAIQAGRRWLASLEAILRRGAPARMLTKPATPAPVLPDEDEPPPWDEDELGAD